MDLREEIGVAIAPHVGTVTIVRLVHDRPPFVGNEQREFFTVEAGGGSTGLLSLADVERYLHGWGPMAFPFIQHGGAIEQTTRECLRVPPGAVAWHPDWIAKVYPAEVAAAIAAGPDYPPDYTLVRQSLAAPANGTATAEPVPFATPVPGV